MAGNEDVARFTAKTVADPVRRVVRLQAARGRQLRERIARAPEGLRRLLRAQLAAVPDDRRHGAARGRPRRQPFDVGTSFQR